ncbi:MAG: hypothetical protein HYR96_03805 [Deltaproteobacteria bacterium]|nr:hypothetical protein [Deltaproteobacteria bacterium]
MQKGIDRLTLDFVVGADVGDENLLGLLVEGDRVAQVFGEIRRKEGGVLRPGTVNDEVGFPEGVFGLRVEKRFNGE